MKHRSLPFLCCVFMLATMAELHAEESPISDDQVVKLLRDISVYDTNIRRLVYTSILDDGTVALSEAEGHDVVVFREGKILRRLGGKGVETKDLCKPSTNAFDQDGNVLVVDTCKPKRQLKKYGREGALLKSVEFEMNGEFKVLGPDRLLFAKTRRSSEGLFLVHEMDGDRLLRSGAAVDKEQEWFVAQYGSHVSLDIYNGKIYVLCAALRDVWELDMELKTTRRFSIESKARDMLNLFFKEGPLTAERLAGEAYSRHLEAYRPWSIKVWRGGMIVSSIRPSASWDTGKYFLEFFDRQGEKILDPVVSHLLPVGFDKKGFAHFVYDRVGEDYLKVVRGRFGFEKP